MKTTYLLDLLTPRPLAEPQWGQRVLATLLDHAPALRPAKYGNSTPLTFEFSSADALQPEAWQWPFLWKSRSPQSEGAIWPQLHERPGHAALTLEILSSSKLAKLSLDPLLRAWADLLEPDVGFLHLVTPAEVERQRALGDYLTWSWSTQQLRRGLPELPWLTIFGPPYIALFGRERLLSAPAYRVEARGDRQIHVQLSAELEDLEGDPAGVAAVRERVIAHLGRDAFLRWGMARYHAPGFDFPGRESLPPRRDPATICAELLQALTEDAAAALAAGVLSLPLIWSVDQQDRPERVAFDLDPPPPSREVAIAEIERRYHNRGMLGSVAVAIARDGLGPDGRTPAVTLHAEHRSGYAAAIALPYTTRGPGFAGFAAPISLEAAPVVFAGLVPGTTAAP